MVSGLVASRRCVALCVDLQDSDPLPRLPPATLRITAWDKLFTVPEMQHIYRMHAAGRYSVGPSNGTEDDVQRGVLFLPGDSILDAFAQQAGPGEYAQDVKHVLEGDEAVFPWFGSPPRGWQPLSSLATTTGAGALGWFMVQSGGDPVAVWIGAGGSVVAIEWLKGIGEGGRTGLRRITHYWLCRLFRVPDDFDPPQ